MYRQWDIQYNGEWYTAEIDDSATFSNIINEIITRNAIPELKDIDSSNIIIGLALKDQCKHINTTMSNDNSYLVIVSDFKPSTKLKSFELLQKVRK